MEEKIKNDTDNIAEQEIAYKTKSDEIERKESAFQKSMSIVVSDMQKNSNTIAPKYLHILEMLMFMLGFVSIKTETNKTTNEPKKKNDNDTLKYKKK